ncbi:MAG: hypothetical protein KKG59_01815, partial [Nanoarchaeota archaeon]|nr:hypothetical protein [Nanoarchaeota archaeon]
MDVYGKYQNVYILPLSDSYSIIVNDIKTATIEELGKYSLNLVMNAWYPGDNRSGMSPDEDIEAISSLTERLFVSLSLVADGESYRRAFPDMWTSANPTDNSPKRAKDWMINLTGLLNDYEETGLKNYDLLKPEYTDVIQSVGEDIWKTASLISQELSMHDDEFTGSVAKGILPIMIQHYLLDAEREKAWLPHWETDGRSFSVNDVGFYLDGRYYQVLEKLEDGDLIIGRKEFDRVYRLQIDPKDIGPLDPLAAAFVNERDENPVMLCKDFVPHHIRSSGVRLENKNRKPREIIRTYLNQYIKEKYPDVTVRKFVDAFQKAIQTYANPLTRILIKQPPSISMENAVPFESIDDILLDENTIKVGRPIAKLNPTIITGKALDKMSALNDI